MTRPARVFLAAAALLLIPAQVQAARLPDWAREIRKNLPPEPEGPSEHDERVLFSETRNEIQPDGTLRIRRRLVVQVLKTDSDEVRVGGFYFGRTGRVTSSRAWHLPPGERAREDVSIPINVTHQDAFLSDTRMRMIAAYGVEKGSVVFFEFEATDTPYFLSLWHSFYEGSPAGRVRFQIEAPTGWEVRGEWLKGPGVEPVVEGKVHTWELTDLNPRPYEPMAPDQFEESPLLVVQAVPPEGIETVPAVFKDWTAASVWYQELAEQSTVVTQEIEEVAEGVQGDELIATVRRTGRFVRDSVRYLDIELGIEGYRPRPASQTLINLYGDCKDKGTLFLVMLASHGIPAYPVLINLTKKNTVSRVLPVLIFNHLVVAVPVPGDLVLPEEVESSLVDGGDLGRLMIVDTTDEVTPVGRVSSSLSGKRGLLVAGQRGRVIEIPAATAEQHSIIRNIEAGKGSDGSMTIRRESSYEGRFAAMARWNYRDSPAERQRGVQNKLLGMFPDATIDSYELQEEGDLFVETISLTRREATGRVSIFPGAVDDVVRVSLSGRRTAVEYPHPFIINYQVGFRGLADKPALPDARSQTGMGWSVSTLFDPVEAGFDASLIIRLDKTRFDPSEFEELRQFWAAAVSASRRTVDLPAPG